MAKAIEHVDPFDAVVVYHSAISIDSVVNDDLPTFGR